MRRRSRVNEIAPVKKSSAQEVMEYETEDLNVFSEEIVCRPIYKDQECQADDSQFMNESLRTDTGKTFICNRLVTVTVDNATQKHTVINDVEIQTNIVQAKSITVLSQKQMQDKGCNTETKCYVHMSVSVEHQELGMKRKSFQDYASLKKEEQLLDLAGVTYDTFEFLLERTPAVSSENSNFSQKDRLFIFLMKLKTGISFSTLGVLFSVHRTTISKIFISTLQYLASSTANLVFWPSMSQVQGTMPKCFYPDYSNTRVIIGCTEFRIECPAGVDNRVFSYSRYKRGYTAKILIGITPGGFISLKSKVNGGRTTDSQLTIESGLIDLLEEGDVVLADKGFPEIRKIIDDSGKSALIILPPYLENKTEFTEKETTETYKIASVRIHVERIMQRLKIYNILNKIPASLFHYMDDLLHVICVLVNLQAPIHGEKSEETDQ